MGPSSSHQRCLISGSRVVWLLACDLSYLMDWRKAKSQVSGVLLLLSGWQLCCSHFHVSRPEAGNLNSFYSGLFRRRNWVQGGSFFPITCTHLAFLGASSGILQSFLGPGRLYRCRKPTEHRPEDWLCSDSADRGGSLDSYYEMARSLCHTLGVSF